MKKEDVLAIIRDMPEDIDPEELMYRIYVLEKIEAGEQAFREGRVIPHEDVVREVRTWRS